MFRSFSDWFFLCAWLILRVVAGALALSVVGTPAHAAAGNVVMQYGGGTYPVASSSCADVMSGVTNEYHTVISCSSDPVVVGTLLNFPGGDGNYVEAIDATPSGGATPPAGGSSEPSYSTWQEAAAAQDVKISTLKTQFETLQTTIGSNGVDPATLEASTLIFAAALLAAVSIYGLRAVWSLFREPGGHD